MSATDRRLGLLNGLAIKPAVECATTANITLSGEQTIDGVTTNESRVLVKNQSNAVENGLYTSDAGEWSRTTDCDGTRDIADGTLVLVLTGSTLATTFWYVTSTDDPIVPGTSSLTWSRAALAVNVAVDAFWESVLATSTASAARAALGLTIGTHVQAYDALLASIAGLSMVADRYMYGTAADTVALGTITSVGRTFLAAATQTAQRTAIGVGADTSNLLKNGGMQVAQRGDGPFTSATTPTNGDDTYQIDRWVFLSDGADVADLSRQADANFASGYGYEIDIETANKQCGIFYPLSADESKQLLVTGAVASLSFKAYRNNGTSIETLRAAILSWVGTADTITSDVVGTWVGAGTTPTLAANWALENTPSGLTLSASIQTFTVENSLIDTASTKQVGVFIWIDDTTLTVGDKVRIGDVKLEASAASTAYVPEHPVSALLACQRLLYVTKKLASRVFGAGLCNQTTTAIIPFQYPVTMRSIPAISVSAAGDFQVLNANSGVDVTALSGATITADGCNLAVTVASGLDAGEATILRDDSGANAQVIASAEL